MYTEEFKDEVKGLIQKYGEKNFKIAYDEALHELNTWEEHAAHIGGDDE